MSKRGKRGGDDGGGGDGFLVMSVSLNLILVIFFVYLNSIGANDEDKSKKALGSLIGKFGMLPSGLQITKGKKLLVPGPSFVTPNKDQSNQEKVFRSLIKGKMRIPEGVTVTREGKELIINLSDNVLFSSGAAEIVPKAEDLLYKLAGILRKQTKPIWIEGYTDDLPISNPRYPSNWELSAARATAVYRTLVEKGKVRANQMTPVGYGEFRPLVPNDRPENRARNRRVRIVIEIGSEIDASEWR